MSKTLLFVYNADSGIFNTLSDIAHKIFAPDTYECNLCAITHGNFAMRSEWKEFLETIDAALEFMHRDEFLKKYQRHDHPLPAVFLKNGEQLELCCGADEINRCRSVRDLELLLQRKMEQN